MRNEDAKNEMNRRTLRFGGNKRRAKPAPSSLQCKCPFGIPLQIAILPRVTPAPRRRSNVSRCRAKQRLRLQLRELAEQESFTIRQAQLGSIRLALKEPMAPLFSLEIRSRLLQQIQRSSLARLSKKHRRCLLFQARLARSAHLQSSFCCHQRCCSNCCRLCCPQLRNRSISACRSLFRWNCPCWFW